MVIMFQISLTRQNLPPHHFGLRPVFNDIDVSDQPPTHSFFPASLLSNAHAWTLLTRENRWKIQESLEEPRLELVIAVFTLMRSSTLLN